uniref:(northern house mosquito) hypothetical protein n=1 Tax=Culex pipiens TaxID=7175 RepID=A0A8D8BKE3_CULPI
MAGGPSTLRQRDIRTSKPKYVFRSNQNFTIYRRRERNSSKPNEIKLKSSSYPVQNCSKPEHILPIDNEIFYFHSSSKLLFVRPKRLRGRDRAQCCQLCRTGNF